MLLPVFEAESTLDETLSSLSQQSLEQFEIVAINDGSSDGTAAILDAWAQREPRLRPLHRPHEGLINALTISAGHPSSRAWTLMISVIH